MAKTVADAVADLLSSSGVTRMFGAPGTTELPLLASLRRRTDIAYTACALDGVAVGIADGYARAKGGFSVVNLHSAQGTLNGAGYIRAAYRDNSPVVVIAGVPSLSYAFFEPNHFVRGLAEMLRPITKWSWSVSHPDEAPLAVARAIHIASAPPAGPTFVALPQDLQVASCKVADAFGFHGTLESTAAAGQLTRAAELLCNAKRPLILAGNSVGSHGAVDEVRSLADALQAPVISEALDRGPQIHAMNFPASDTLSVGFFDIRNPLVKELLSGCDVLLVLGCKATYSRVIGTLPAGTQVIQVDQNPLDIGKNHAVAVGLVGNFRIVVEDLAKHVRAAVGERHRAPALAPNLREANDSRRDERKATLDAVQMSGRPIGGRQLAKALVLAADQRTVFVDDSQAFGGYLKRYVEFSRPGSLFGSMASHLGWALPAAVGIQVARPEDRVVCLVSDGSFLFSVQALATAARLGIPLVTVAINNRSFVSLKLEIQRYGSFTPAELEHLDLSPPDFDYGGIAEGFGVRSRTVTEAAELTGVLEEALQADGPTVVDVVMSDCPDDWSEGWYIAPP